MNTGNREKPDGSVPERGYVGRFAPSPTGPLHFGSLLAATASYLQAKAAHGAWHLRIDDLDGPRCDEKWNGVILQSLESFGFEWTGEVVFQSNQQRRYQDAVDELIELELLFDCSCSRKQLAKTAERGDSGFIYPGHCRSKLSTKRQPTADCSQRLLVGDSTIDFVDGWQGVQHRDLGKEDGDFVVWRRDALPSYQLAVVVDDAAIGVTEVVRGTDLLSSTPKQIYLQQQLGLPTPAYRHLGVAVNEFGRKISKLTDAPALNHQQPVPELYSALAALNQSPPDALRKSSVTECWQWATANWQPERLMGIESVLID